MSEPQRAEGQLIYSIAYSGQYSILQDGALIQRRQGDDNDQLGTSKVHMGRDLESSPVSLSLSPMKNPCSISADR